MHRALQDFSLLPSDFYKLPKGEQDFITASIIQEAENPKIKL